jgi:hypothetical protein
VDINEIMVRMREIKNPRITIIDNTNITVPNKEISEIRNQDIQGINTGDVKVYEIRDPVVTGLTVPVTVDAGKPIVNIPGCVKAHKDNAGKNKNLVDDDPKGVMTLCDGQQPAFSPMDYQSDELTFEQEKYEPNLKIPPPEVPEPPEVPAIQCYEPQIKDPVTGQCIDKPTQNTEQKDDGPSFAEQYLPEVSTVTTTAAIAVVATSSALLAKPLADLLLKVIKPAVKQTMTKIQRLLGKNPYKPSRNEIIANAYREKKGLLPLKPQKKKKDK